LRQNNDTDVLSHLQYNLQLKKVQMGEVCCLKNMCLNCANIWAEFVQFGIRYLKAVKFLPLNEDQGCEFEHG